MMILCSPGNHYQECMAEKYGCSVGLIKEMDAKHLPVGASMEDQYQATRAWIEDMKLMGFQAKQYCHRCEARATG